MKSIHTTVRDQFSQHAEYYAQSSVHAKGDTLEVILNFADPKGTEKVLDIATGTGFTAFVLAPKVAHVVATDLTPEMVAKASELATGTNDREYRVFCCRCRISTVCYCVVRFSDLSTCPSPFSKRPKILV